MDRKHASRVPDCTYLFTVLVSYRLSRHLLNRPTLFEAAITAAQKHKPFIRDSEVILRDRIHAIWILPEGDVDFTTRWDRFKATIAASEPRADLAGDNWIMRAFQPRITALAIRGEADLERYRKLCQSDAPRKIAEREKKPQFVVHLNPRPDALSQG